MEQLKLEQVDIGYGGQPLIQKIDLSFLQGKMTCILGSNGAGKTTLLKTIARIIKPLGGVIRFGGEDVRQINGVRYRIRARRNLTTWNVVLHIEAREGEVQSFMYASEADVLFDVEYRGHVFKTPVNPRGTMKDLKVNAVTVGLAGAGDA